MRFISDELLFRQIYPRSLPVRPLNESVERRADTVQSSFPLKRASQIELASAEMIHCA